MDKIILINDSIEYSIIGYNKNDSYGEFYIILKTDDLAQVKKDFKQIESIEIKVLSISSFVSTAYDTYSGIELLTSHYIENNVLKDALKITLTKSDIAAQVSRIDKQLNPTVNISDMSLDEYKSYKKAEISQRCQDDIFSGLDIELTDCTKHFSYKSEDQINIAQAISTIINGKGTITHVPYHADGEFCSMYSVEDMITIYSSLQMMLTSKTTYTNMMNMYISSLPDKDSVNTCHYGVDLPESYQIKMKEIIDGSNEIMKALLKSLSEVEDEENS